MATRTLEQTIKELEARIEKSFYCDLDCDILEYLKEYSSKKDELEEELQKATLETCKTAKIARILTELIEEKSSKVEESDEDIKYEEPPLENSPSLEGVTGVIRCENCKWWDRLEDGHPYGYCRACRSGTHTERWEISIYRQNRYDFYCADAEPKENEDDDE